MSEPNDIELSKRLSQSSRPSLLHAGAGTTPQDAELSSVSQSTVNLIKTIVGAGMLSLPAGISAFSGSKAAVQPTLAVTLLLAVISAFGFVFLAEVCKRSGESTYKDVWRKTVSPSTCWLPAVVVMLDGFLGCVQFAMIIGESLSKVFEMWHFYEWLCVKWVVKAVVAVFVLLPLCSMQSLTPLAKFSVLGVLSNVYVCAFVLLRYFDGSYSKGGDNYALLQRQDQSLQQNVVPVPSFLEGESYVDAWSAAASSDITKLVSMLATAFLAHFNAPTFYEQLAPDESGDKERPFLVMSVVGFAAAAAIMSLVMCFGFLTFGKACGPPANPDEFILSNYATDDTLAVVARLAVSMSLITSFPLVFFSYRSQVAALFGDFGEKFAAERPMALTVGLLSLSMAFALYLEEIGVVAEITGALFGSFLIYVSPPLMLLGAQLRGLGPPGGSFVYTGEALMMLLGLALGIVGTLKTH